MSEVIGLDESAPLPAGMRFEHGKAVPHLTVGEREARHGGGGEQDLADVQGGERRLGHDELARGLVQVEFNRRGSDDPSGDED